ncbi:MAG: alanine--tRNA ligase [Candidatus Hydromicrobium americanum]|nr:MAG: alanine--tRNA ligase [Candidatus Hydromicrobium americanum]
MDIRKIFLNYFEKNDHLILPSSSLIPEDDPSVLLTTAGMQQFKPYFLGIKKPPGKRITTVQKCFRTSDIDRVGYTDKHLTFFEMLGNFSFGDYFKEEAIKYSLDFILNTLKIPLEKLLVAVFKGDKDIPADLESIEHWKENGINADKIYKFGKEENFWGPAGETGPCGPCSEIFYDFGKEYGCGKDSCNLNCDCSRFLEMWNLVFTQYNFDGKKYNELPKKNIDTGMGLERVTAVLEGNPSIFKTSLFDSIMKKIEEISERKINYKNGKKASLEFDKSTSIIADHARAIYFLISDGVTPSNEGRGYILRRIIRRAVRYGKLIGIEDYFLNEIGEVVVSEYSKIYPELLEKKEFSFKLVKDEEKRFTKTLKEGSKVLIQKINRIKKDNKEYLDPEDAFRLYDTFGFPVELTGEILNENKLKLNMEKFNEYLKKHTEKSKSKILFDKKIGSNLEIYHKINKNLEVEFIGYKRSKAKTIIENIIKIDKNGNTELTSKLYEGEKGEIILRETPFYGEKGGQIGDKGIIRKGENFFVVTNCKIPVEGINIHKGGVKKGELEVGDEVSAEVDYNRRINISKNHTATHLLHWALRNVFGSEIKQSGSFVGEDMFRFDYSIYTEPSEEDLRKVERMINEKIQNNDSVRCFETTREFAEEIGAISLFGEKYGKFVRVVEINNYSRELCGGIHVNRTGDIGIFKIIMETSIGANLRRIEAATGMHAYNYLAAKERILNNISASLEVEDNRVLDTLKDIKDNIKKKEEELTLLQIKIAKKEIINKFKYDPLSNSLKIIDFNFSNSKLVPTIEIKSMGIVGDEMKNYFEGKNTFIIFGNILGNKPVMLLQATADLVKKGIDCGKIAREVSEKLKGGGGGKPYFAQLGGSDPDSLDGAIDFVRDRVLKYFKKGK